MGRRARLKKLRKQQERSVILGSPAQRGDSRIRSWTSSSTALSSLPKGQDDRWIAYAAYAVVIITIASLAFTILKPGFPSGHDIAAHIVRSKILQEALYQGQFPVRWVEWAWAGTSHPMFNFYQGGFYYLVASLDRIIPSHIESIKITVLLLWWLGAGFMFLFMRRFGNLEGALSALVFVFTPYIIGDVFVRAAYPEFSAIAFSMGVLWSFDRIVRMAKPFYAIPLSICTMGIITSHLPTLVIISPVIIAYLVLLFIKQEVNLRGIIYASFAVVLGIGLAGFYIFPALFELKYIKNELLTSGYYDFHPHFVSPQQLIDTKWGYGISREGLDDGMSFQFGLLQWLIIAATFVVLGTSLFRKKTKHQFPVAEVTFWLSMICYAVFFMHDVSIQFWENWRFISFIQYPWRFLMIVAIATASLSGLLLTLVREPRTKVITLFLGLLAIILLYRSFLAPSTFVKKEDFDIDAPDWRTREGIVINSFVEEGYLPRDVEVMPRRDIGKWEVVKSNVDPPQEGYTKDPRVEEKVIKDHVLSFVITTPEPLIFRLNIHYFPGWKVFVDGREVEPEHGNIYGFMNVAVPQGLHTLEARFTDTTIRSISNKVTILSFLILLAWQLFSLTRGRLVKPKGL